MSFSANYPPFRPSLNLNFARAKVLDPRVTFARASTGTYYDGVTTAKAEENLFRQSQDFTDVTYWITNSASVSYTANTTVAPDGTTTADTMTASVGTGTRFGSGNATNGITTGLVYTASLFVKAGTDTVVQLLFPTAQFGSDAYANFDLSAGTVGSVGASATATISSAGGTWYRCSITATATASSTASIGVGFAFTGNNSSATRLPSITAAGTETLILWGAQLEQRSSATSYTATTTQSITNYIPVLLTAATNAPRFDHNPTTGESLGLLIEESRTNLLTYSAEFDNAAWGKTRSSITSNTIVAPDGTLTGDKLVEDTTASNTHQTQRAVGAGSVTPYSFSVYMKAGERARGSLVLVNATGSASFNGFDLSSGTLIGSPSVSLFTAASASIAAAGNGWYRCTLTATPNDTSTLNVAIRLSDGSSPIYTGDGYSGIYIWGAQLEAGAFSTSYIATGAATATRSADSASMTGTNFSSWYNQSEGAFFAEFATATPTTARILQIGDGTGNNRVDNFMAANQFAVFVQASGSTQVTGSATGILAANVFGKVSFAYKTNDFAWLLNAGAVSTDASGVVPTVDQIGIGRRLDSGTFLNGTIRRIAYYTLRLPNAQLQALTI